MIYMYRFNRAASLEAGFSRLVRLVLRAWRIAVRARVRFICADRAMSGAAAHWAGSATTRPFLGPELHRHFIETPPDPGFFLNTRRVSVINSLALIRCPVLLPLGNDHMHTPCSDRKFRRCIHAHNVRDGDSDYKRILYKLFPLSYHPCNWLAAVDIHFKLLDQ